MNHSMKLGDIIQAQKDCVYIHLYLYERRSRNAWPMSIRTKQLQGCSTSNLIGKICCAKSLHIIVLIDS
ncbi:uncharacterized protein Smp_203150 [Schistosoma mansoni]|uniref:uncharacterized protein n=1 Tax=Schistosoma mansoni TaxID=6183 RepID=UPI00022DC84B|nr:uncharacterized protein Smp_203150 [Schistosoma mansoni]|eukprot:XP_018653086.1 uncharacterized protein Smp_203150 [Schistosoma mansoni]